MTSPAEHMTPHTSEHTTAHISAQPAEHTQPSPLKRLNTAIIRRQTHSSRAISSVVLAIIVLAAALYLFVEALLRLVGDHSWLFSLSRVSELVSTMPASSAKGLGIALAIIALILGLCFVLKALLPGRLARTGTDMGRTAAVTDNQSIASALAKVVRESTGLSSAQVLVSVGHSSVEVRLRPTSGLPVDTQAVKEEVEQALKVLHTGSDTAHGAPRVHVRISPHGAVGGHA